MEKKDADTKKYGGPQVTRRGFLTTMGVGVATVAGIGSSSAEPASTVVGASATTQVTLTINGREHRLLVEPRWTLLFVLREKLGLTGTKVSCERGECGACTVLIDNAPKYSCMTLALEAEGTRITTVEGLMNGEELGHSQQAFLEMDALQCGYCAPGQIMAVEGLLREIPQPTLAQIRVGVSGNLCRCGSYANIFKAAERAAELKAEKGGKP